LNLKNNKRCKLQYSFSVPDDWNNRWKMGQPGVVLIPTESLTTTLLSH